MDITHDHPLHSLCLRGATFFQNVLRHVFALKRMATPRNAQIRQQDNANSAIAMQIRQSEMQRTFATSGANMRVKGYRFFGLHNGANDSSGSNAIRTHQRIAGMFAEGGAPASV